MSNLRPNEKLEMAEMGNLIIIDKPKSLSISSHFQGRASEADGIMNFVK